MRRLVRDRASRLVLASLALALAALPPVACAGAEAEGPLYVKKESWAQTMLATRAAYVAHRAAQRQQSGNPNSRAFVSEPISGDGPGQKISVDVSGCRWMRLVTVLEQGGGNCHIWGNARLIAKDGSATWLGDLKPALVRVGWGQLLVDKNWKDNPLRIGNQKFDHGIWVHSNSNVCYALKGKYQRFEAWVGMDADRATGVARFKVLFEDPDLTRELWQSVARDFPRESRWLEDDLGRNPESWFDSGESAGSEQIALGQVLRTLGRGGEPLRQRLDGLRRSKAPGSDAGWLDLYLQACQMRACCEPLQRIWLADLREAMEAQFADLLAPGVAVDDPRWAQRRALSARVAEPFAPSRPLASTALWAAIQSLSSAMPGRLQGAAALQARVQRQQQRLGEVVPAAARGEEKALAELASLAAEATTIRRELLSTLPGMKDFLAQAAHLRLPEEWESQFQTLAQDVAQRSRYAPIAAEVYRPEAMILDTDRDPLDVALRRTAALLSDLKRRCAPGSLEGLEKELAELEKSSAAVDPSAVEARFALFAAACRVRRQLSLRNPLLDFDRILFVKRHRALFNHMCDQYYGMAATPGGGLYVLEDAFGPTPRVRDVLAESTVKQGRLKGQRLSGGSTTPPAVRFDGMGNRHGEDTGGGSFLSPDLSFDARSVLFAYVECRGDTLHRHHVDPAQGHWHEGRCYHVFRVGLDGSDLRQLTDGTWNDFDPCWLPNGRVAFISERRGGYLRCGRVCPTYTLYDMAADGSDINCLSFHETNEWHPSVTHDGRILYTRWDYVDRFGCTAHHPWITTLDGRDSRAVHGNFAPRTSRPDMELDCRSIPGSPKLIATAAPHHGQAYGSLVLIDPRVPDDDGMGPVRRVTPDVGFPESQGGAQVYGTPWPLSEDYYLCVYDARMTPGAGYQGGPSLWGDYGIYLVDAFGNKELIYRDPEISCLSPIPVRPRPTPVALPEVVKRSPHSDPAARPRLPQHKPEATLALINVYGSLRPWPEGTKIKELRVLQVLPMTVPSGGPPHETALRVATAGDSVVPVRWVLGTVPVEADGSAHFTVPAHREMFFQALDEKGLAVQSMRSATYLQEGERLVCIGCHEPKHRSPEPLAVPPIALRRGPSTLKPDVEGSNPFSYPRLVQPVLDKHCVECHSRQANKTFSLAREPLVGRWFTSYANLVRPYGFHDYGNGLRTTPGQFGAKASRLYEILRKGHYDVKLSEEEMHRITLWLDCTSMFYGVYEKEGGEAQLRGEPARPTLE